MEVRSDYDASDDENENEMRYNNYRKKVYSDFDSTDMKIANKVNKMKKSVASDMDHDDALFSPMIVFQLRAGDAFL